MNQLIGIFKAKGLWGGWLHFTQNFWEDEQAKFRLTTTLKIFAINLVTLVIQASVILVLLNFNMLFFKSYNISGLSHFETIFYDSALTKLYDAIWEITFFLIFLMCMGMYISKLILRPFKTIGNYCEDFLHNTEASYDPDLFTDLKLLTRFSEYFFLQIETSLKSNTPWPRQIPDKYKGIYKPRFEYSFFTHFFILIMIISALSSFGLYSLMGGMYESIVNLSTNTLVLDEKTQSFLVSQEALFKDVTTGLVIVHLIFYFILTHHLYSKVAAPSFAIFATMRSFLRGNMKARVHLIGNYYARAETKKLNRYLDQIEKNISEFN